MPSTFALVFQSRRSLSSRNVKSEDLKVLQCEGINAVRERELMTFEAVKTKVEFRTSVRGGL